MDKTVHRCLIDVKWVGDWSSHSYDRHHYHHHHHSNTSTVTSQASLDTSHSLCRHYWAETYIGSCISLNHLHHSANCATRFILMYTFKKYWMRFRKSGHENIEPLSGWSEKINIRDKGRRVESRRWQVAGLMGQTPEKSRLASVQNWGKVPEQDSAGQSVGSGKIMLHLQLPLSIHISHWGKPITLNSVPCVLSSSKCLSRVPARSFNQQFPSWWSPACKKSSFGLQT